MRHPLALARSVVLGALVVAAGAACSKERGGAAAGRPRPSPTEADALWAMAPAGAHVGVVVTPRALQLLEGGAVEVQALLARPELAGVGQELADKLGPVLGGPFTSLAALGIDRERGFALWSLDGGGTVAVLPVADAARLKQLLGDDDADPARIAGLSCQASGAMQLCASDQALLAALGKAKPPAALATVGARGDVEVVVTGDQSVVAVAQLDRGELVLRAARSGALPPQVAAVFGRASRPRVDATTASFGVASIQGVLGLLPDEPLPGGVRVSELAKNIDGAFTITVAGGTRTFDMRVRLRDPAPFAAVLAHCDELIPPNMRGPTQAPGACRFILPTGAMELEAWIDGKELRLGARAAPRGARVELSALGRELAGRDWAFAMWGRGTVFDSGALLPPGAPVSPALLSRALSLVNELGVAVRLDGDVAHAVIGVRTLWSNPPDVVEKVLAIPSEDIAAGKAVPAAEAIARGAPRAPFAQDVAAGAGGLMVPTAGVGMVAAIAIPAFMRYQQGAKRSEAELELDAIARAARVYHAEHGALPAQTAPLTPARSCCEFSTKRCETTAAEWATPAWEALDFERAEPSFFRYGYQSDGATLTATAVGDLDCDGDEVTYTLTITTAGGTPEVSMTRPTTRD